MLTCTVHYGFSPNVCGVFFIPFFFSGQAEAGRDWSADKLMEEQWFKLRMCKSKSDEAQQPQKQAQAFLLRLHNS